MKKREEAEQMKTTRGRAKVESGDESDDYIKQLELQRKAFEAQFGSLEDLGYNDKVKEKFENDSSSKDEETEGSEEGSGSDTSLLAEEEESLDDFQEEEGEGDDDDSNEESGTSDAENESTPSGRSETTENKVRVIKFKEPTEGYSAPTVQEQKWVRSGKTLALLAKIEQRKNEAQSRSRRGKSSGNGDGGDNDNDDEEENIKNDLELQRFLRESHILSAFGQNSVSGVNLTLSGLSQGSDDIDYHDDQIIGKARLRTLEMRLKSLSRVNGDSRKIDKLEKMPMNLRKRLVANHQRRIAKYEQEARDAGIVLSKVKKGEFRKIGSSYKGDIEKRIGSGIKNKTAERNKRRDRGLKINSVGKNTKHGLVISKEELRCVRAGKR